jgi:hypothetical protein
MWFWIAPPCCAGGRELAVEADPGALLGAGDRERERSRSGEGLVEGVEAAQRRAADDAARVEADQVEAGPHRVGEQEAAQSPDELDA